MLKLQQHLFLLISEKENTFYLKYNKNYNNHKLIIIFIHLK